jgi:hypothetical protein
MNNQACCAHCKVVLKHKEYLDGSMSDYWVCADDCGAQFMVIPNVYPDKVFRNDTTEQKAPFTILLSDTGEYQGKQCNTCEYKQMDNLIPHDNGEKK